MKNLLKRIRTYLKLSQAEFAKQLNISFATVNRWENGHAEPNRLAQTSLYAFCKERNVPVYDMILAEVSEIRSEIDRDENRVILYHGSKSGIDGKIIPSSRKQCDFGKGFYMETDPNQALTLICDYENAVLYILSIAVDDLDILYVPADIDWAMLVAYHRGKMEEIRDTDFYRKYSQMTVSKDLVIGSIANDRMFYVIDNFFIGNITDLALVHSLSVLQLGKQYVAISEKGCNAVRIEREIPLSYLEKQFIKDMAEENRMRGVSLANEACKSYRRQGLFFDEILEQAKEGKSQ